MSESAFVEVFVRSGADGLIDCAMIAHDGQEIDGWHKFFVPRQIYSSLPGRYSVEGATLVDNGMKPSDFHEWSNVEKAWLPNFNAVRASRLQQVAAELNARLYLPCNGFDADKVSRERISGTIARLQRGDGLPAGWIGWRDASNQQQWATDDAATVLANLTALSRAIEDREQALLVASWQHKAAIAALPDVDAILAYDVAAGWPG